MFTDPIKNLKAFGLGEDMIVADLGAGTGFYSIPAAKMVPKGKLYAIEIQEDFLKTILNKSKEENLNNLECLRGDIEKHKGTKLGDGIIDRAIASNVFFQVEDKDNFIKELKRILKVGGKVMLIDWDDESHLLSKNGHKPISKKEAQESFMKNGFNFDYEVDAGIHHYGMIFTRT